MYTTTTQDGLLNNYAVEPKLYYATYPSPEQQSQYVKQAGIAALLVAAALMIAAVVS
jgi:hypothetical protein